MNVSEIWFKWLNLSWKHKSRTGSILNSNLPLRVCRQVGTPIRVGRYSHYSECLWRKCFLVKSKLFKGKVLQFIFKISCKVSPPCAHKLSVYDLNLYETFPFFFSLWYQLPQSKMMTDRPCWQGWLLKRSHHFWLAVPVVHSTFITVCAAESMHAPPQGSSAINWIWGCSQTA